jgi:hypothetical protein
MINFYRATKNRATIADRATKTKIRATKTAR